MLNKAPHTSAQNEWMNGWLAGWIDGWVNEWMEEIMSGWMKEWMNEWMNEWIGEWMNRWMNGWMDEWMSECGNWMVKKFASSLNLHMTLCCLCGTPGLLNREGWRKQDKEQA